MATDRNQRVVGLDFEEELVQGNKDETPPLCVSLSFSLFLSLSLFSCHLAPRVKL